MYRGLWQNIFMNKSVFYFIFFIPFVFSGEKLTFNLTCEILQSPVVTLEKGKSQTYSGHSKDLGEGDLFSFNFIYEVKDKDHPHRLNVKDDLIGFNLDFALKRSDDDNPFFINLLRVMNFYGKESILTGTSSGILSYDDISIIDPTYEFKLKRYYLNDWQMIYFDMFDGGGFIGKPGYQIVTANCMGMPDEFNSIIDSLK